MFGAMDIYTVDIPGHGDAHFDPLAIRRQLLLHTHGRCWEYADDAHKITATLAAISDTDQSDKAKAERAELSLRLADIEGKLADAAFAAFPFRPVDPNTGEGVTESAALLVLGHYLRYVAAKKAEAGNSPTS